MGKAQDFFHFSQKARERAIFGKITKNKYFNSLKLIWLNYHYQVGIANDDAEDLAAALDSCDKALIDAIKRDIKNSCDHETQKILGCIKTLSQITKVGTKTVEIKGFKNTSKKKIPIFNVSSNRNLAILDVYKNWMRTSRPKQLLHQKKFTIDPKTKIKTYLPDPEYIKWKELVARREFPLTMRELFHSLEKDGISVSQIATLYDDVRGLGFSIKPDKTGRPTKPLSQKGRDRNSCNTSIKP